MTDASARSAMTEEAARRRAFLIAWAGIAGFMALQTTANAFSQLRDLPRVDPREPFVWEYSSAVVVVALVPALSWLLRKVPPARRDWLKVAAIYAGASLLYSAVHVLGFVAIRKGLYALVGAHYRGIDFVYEYRKDLVGYAGFLLILWVADWAAGLWARSRAEAAGPRLYQLRDGSRIVRVPMEDIVAVASARNYVEFHLAGGRKPLVRETLAKVEQDLAAAGFLRTHRSWLVNPNHVRAITPAAGGDFRLELADGLTAPLSRRFPEALEALRTPAAAGAVP